MLLRTVKNETASFCASVANSLECGEVIYLPHNAFDVLHAERWIFNEHLLAAKYKNISYSYLKAQLSGYDANFLNIHQYTVDTLQALMQRFALFAKNLIDSMFPHYTNTLLWGRTSYRPAEIKNRSTSKRKDDTRLHVDAFAATPVHGLRILRVFSNVNPYNIPRIWMLGEDFTDVIKRFKPQLTPYRPWLAKLLYMLHMTKSVRSKYDHIMLQLHDAMKLDDRYQALVHKMQVNFLPQTSWICFSDQTSHAAISGQFLMEQTFYLPESGMLFPEKSPHSIIFNME